MPGELPGRWANNVTETHLNYYYLGQFLLELRD